MPLLNTMFCSKGSDAMVDDAEFLKFVAGVLDVPVASISLQTAYESIPQWDSVMHLRRRHPD